ncbi:MAG: MAPEG family protein [Pseudomonadota bacterium]
MPPFTLLYPVFALAAWTLCVLVLVLLRRVAAARRGEVSAGDFRYGESDRVPPKVRLAGRNYANLLELPVLFYVVCLVLQMTGGNTPAARGLAWAYVLLRIVHSLIHVGPNRVMLRLAAFAASNGALVALWVLAGLHLAAAARVGG